MTPEALREEALALDASDPPSGFREAFAMEEPGTVYLKGNSLGRMPQGSTGME